MHKATVIKLYGAADCHKTQYYQTYLSDKHIDYHFYDVIKDEKAATELRSLYATGKLNFPTLTIGDKKLRNPSEPELYKWILRQKALDTTLVHDNEKQVYSLAIEKEQAVVSYRFNANIMYLTHSEVPTKYRGLGLGKVLVEKTFEKLTEEKHKAVAECTYIKRIAQRHSKWKSIIG